MVGSCLSVDEVVNMFPFVLDFDVPAAVNFVDDFESPSFGGFIFRCVTVLTAKLIGLVLVVGVVTVDGFVDVTIIVAGASSVGETSAVALLLGRPRTIVGVPDTL